MVAGHGRHGNQDRGQGHDDGKQDGASVFSCSG